MYFRPLRIFKFMLHGFLVIDHEHIKNYNATDLASLYNIYEYIYIEYLQ